MMSSCWSHRFVHLVILAYICSSTFAAPIGPGAILLGGLGATALMSSGSGGFHCIFNYNHPGCKGERKLKEEEQRQTAALIDSLMASERMKQADQIYNIETSSKINQNYLNDATSLNGFKIQSMQALTDAANNHAATQGSQVLENIQMDKAMQSRINNDGQNNVKAIADLAVNLNNPPKLSQAEYDELFST